jgi:hypothetical protein
VHAILLLLLLAGDTPAQPAVISPEARDAALSKAFRFLDDSIWKLSKGGSPQRQYAMAVAAHAYLLAGDRGGRRLPSRKKQLARMHDELVRYVDGVLAKYGRKERPRKDVSYAELIRAHKDHVQWTWVLGVAAPYFAESLARGKRTGECRRTLDKIVRILEASQQEGGGWGHHDARLIPTRQIRAGLKYPAEFVAPSYCALSALGIARTALGRKTDSKALRDGRAYFARCQSEDGTYPYAYRKLPPGWKPGMGPIAVARTSGVAYALFCAGAKATDPVALKALRAIDARPLFMAEGCGSATLSLQYGGLLSYARGTQAWRAFRSEYFPRILENQEKSGAFLCISRGVVGSNNETRPRLPPGLKLPRDVAAHIDRLPAEVYVTAIHSLLLLLERTDSLVIPRMPAPPGPVSGR